MLTLNVKNLTSVAQTVHLYEVTDPDNHTYTSPTASFTLNPSELQTASWPENSHVTCVRDAGDGHGDTITGEWVWGTDGGTRNLQIVGAGPYSFRVL